MKTFMAVAAFAATMVMGSVLPSSAATLQGSPFNDQETAFFGNKVGGGATATSFTDLYSFSISGNTGTVSVALNNVGRVIGNFIARLYLGTTASGPVLAETNIDTTRPQQISFGDTPIGSGTYTIAVSGITPTGQASSYSGTAYFTVSSVPLPSTVALFGTAVLGLGIAGAARKKKASVEA